MKTRTGICKFVYLTIKQSVMNIFENRIVLDQDVCNGKPTIKGTRITVQTILEFLSSGDDMDIILENYPSLTKEDIKTGIRFAANLLDRNYTIKTVS